MKSILIIGYGKWAKKILNVIKKSKLFDKIYITSRRNSFIFKNNFKRTIKILPRYNKIDILHVCSPITTHYKYLKKFLNHKCLIVEKPFLKSLNEMVKIHKNINKKNCRVIVNYIDLYNPIVNILKNKLKNKYSTVIFEYSDPKVYFKKKYLCIEDWIEHPLSLILFLFKKFTKFRITKKIFIRKKNNFLEKVEIEFMYENILVVIRINLSKKKTRKIYFFQKKELKLSVDLKKNKIVEKKITIFSNSKINSIVCLYKSGLSKKRTFYQSFNFYKKVLKERISILNSLKNITNHQSQ